MFKVGTLESSIIFLLLLFSRIFKHLLKNHKTNQFFIYLFFDYKQVVLFVQEEFNFPHARLSNVVIYRSFSVIYILTQN